MLLSDAKIRNTSPKPTDHRIADGDGLYLLVGKAGTKRWVFRYRFAGKERSISLGKYPAVSLAAAREKKQEAKNMIANGTDPCLAKRKRRIHAQFQENNTFRQMTKEWYEINKAIWTEDHGKKVWMRFEKYIFPDLGNMPVSEIEPVDVLRVIQKIEKTGATYVSRRMAESCKRVFSYAICTTRIKHNPASDLNEALVRHRAQHYPTLRPSELPKFLHTFEKQDCGEIYRIAFKLLLLTALRTCELRYSQWHNVDFESREWYIPKELMKMNEAHVVFLSDQAVALLKRLHEITGHQEWMFLNPRPIKHPVISENFATNIIKSMSYQSKLVGHGFRALFSTVCNEHKKSKDAVERQLAHRERNPSRAAYDRSYHYEERKEILQWWADYLDRSMVVKPANAALDLGQSPSYNPVSKLHGFGINSSLNAAIPSALAYGNKLKNVFEPQETILR